MQDENKEDFHEYKELGAGSNVVPISSAKKKTTTGKATAKLIEIPEIYHKVFFEEIISPLIMSIPLITEGKRNDHIIAQDYKRWENIAFALTAAFGTDTASARYIFEEWSSQDYNMGEAAINKWVSADSKEYDRSISLGTIIHHARQNGYKYPLWEELFEKRKDNITDLEMVEPILTAAKARSVEFHTKCALVRRYLKPLWTYLRDALKTFPKNVLTIGAFEKDISNVVLPASFGDDEKKNPAQLIIDIAKDNFTFFQTDAHSAIAVRQNDYLGSETYFVTSKPFRLELRHLCRENNIVPSKDALNTAVEDIESIALRSEVKKLHTRVAKFGDKHYIDICNKERNVIEIDKTGWRIIQNPPVLFIRRDGALPLAIPNASGAKEGLEHLKWLLREKTNPSAFVLEISWMLWAMQEADQYPNLAEFAKSDSGKSTRTSFIRGWIDPHKLDKRSLSKNERDMYIAMSMQHVYLLDNVSARRPLSDSEQIIISKANTGGGRGDKTNYTDVDETVIVITKPTIINGINNCITNEDLHSRTIFVEIEPFQQDEKVDSEIVTKRYNDTKGEVLAALLDIFVHALNNIDNVTIDKNEARMIGFTRFSVAAEGAYTKPGSFLEYFGDTAKEAAVNLVQAELTFEVLVRTFNALADTTRKMMKQNEGKSEEAQIKTLVEIGSNGAIKFEGEPNELYSYMAKHSVRQDISTKGYYPKNPQALTRWLRTHSTLLKKIGCYAYDSGRSGKQRRFVVEISSEVQKLFGYEVIGI